MVVVISGSEEKTRARAGVLGEIKSGEVFQAGEMVACVGVIGCKVGGTGPRMKHHKKKKRKEIRKMWGLAIWGRKGVVGRLRRSE